MWLISELKCYICNSAEPDVSLPACVKSKHETGDHRSPREGGGGSQNRKVKTDKHCICGCHTQRNVRYKMDEK